MHLFVEKEDCRAASWWKLPTLGQFGQTGPLALDKLYNCCACMTLQAALTAQCSACDYIAESRCSGVQGWQVEHCACTAQWLPNGSPHRYF